MCSDMCSEMKWCVTNQIMYSDVYKITFSRSDRLQLRIHIQNRVEQIRSVCSDVHIIDQIMCSVVYKIVKSCSAGHIMCSDVHKTVFNTSDPVE
jgi:hypothetical protein